MWVNNGDDGVHTDITRDEYRPSSRTDPLGAGLAVPAVHGDSGAETKKGKAEEKNVGRPLEYRRPERDRCHKSGRREAKPTHQRDDMQWERAPECLGPKRNRVLGGGKRAGEWVDLRHDERLLARLGFVTPGLAAGGSVTERVGDGL